ncbi:XVIPCD domain-containing protein [Xanthomonas campestris]|uniref:XVIPCD domain-containing protein n=1 Tax=Xanthomonas campestris TaxID=339 RepID=UPI0030828F5B
MAATGRPAPSRPGRSPGGSACACPGPQRHRTSVAWITPQHQAGSVAYLWCVVQRFPSEKISVSLLATAKEGGLSRVDHVVLGNTPGDGAGQRLFVVQGELNNPAHLRSSIKAEEAAKTPVEQSFAKVEQISNSQQERALAAQQEPALEQSRAPMQMG